MLNDIIIRLTDMPIFIRGHVCEDADGDYNIYINSRLSYNQQVKALSHELKHIKRNDIDNVSSIFEAECV